MESEKKILGIPRIYGPHASENLGAAFKTVLPIEHYYQISCVVTDNAKNIVASVNHLEFENFGCVAHTIQLCIKVFNEFKEIITLIEKCKSLVTHFHHSVNVNLDIYSIIYDLFLGSR